MSGRRRMPLRIALTLVSTVVIVAVAATIGAVTVALLTRHLTEQLDRQVAAAAMRLTGPPPGGPAADPAPPPDPGGPLLCAAGPPAAGPVGRQPDDSVFAIYQAGDPAAPVTAAVRGGYPDCTVLAADRAAELRTVPLDGTVVTVELAGVGRYRASAHTDGARVLVSGVSTAEVDATRDRLVLVLAAVITGAVLIGGVAVWWSVRRALAPLEQVAATARQASVSSLDRGAVDLPMRVPAGLTDPRTEAGAVGAALNRLLDHVDEALTVRAASEQKMRSFVADASHELRTPLTSIRGYAELARRHPADVDAARRALGRIESQAVRMSELIEDLLLLARLDAARAPVAAPVDLAALAVEVVADAQVAAPDHVWAVTVPDRPVRVRGDRAGLLQVLTNLTANARVHTPAGTAVTVTVAAADAQTVTVAVTDDGPGIDPQTLPSVFDRFVRGDESRARTTGSTGLGLAIVEGLVRAHGGEIAVDSVPGRTEFLVTLPADPEPGPVHSVRTADG